MLEVGEPDAQLSGLVAAQVRDQGVRHAHEVLEDASCLVAAKVQRDRALVAVEALEEEGVRPLLVRRDVARHVAADRRVLDLDHLGPEVGELHRREGARAVLLDRDDANVGQRAGHEPRSAHRSASITLPAEAVTSASAPGRKGEMSIS